MSRSVPVLNNGNTSIPPFGLMQGIGLDTATGAIIVQEPANDSMQGLFVNGEGSIAVGDYGKGFHDNFAIIAADPSGGSPGVGDTLGSAAGSWYAAIDNLGFQAQSDGFPYITNVMRVSVSSISQTAWKVKSSVGNNTYLANQTNLYAANNTWVDSNNTAHVRGFNNETLNVGSRYEGCEATGIDSGNFNVYAITTGNASNNTFIGNTVIKGVNANFGTVNLLTLNSTGNVSDQHANLSYSNQFACTTFNNGQKLIIFNQGSNATPTPGQAANYGFAGWIDTFDQYLGYGNKSVSTLNLTANDSSYSPAGGNYPGNLTLVLAANGVARFNASFGVEEIIPFGTVNSTLGNTSGPLLSLASSSGNGTTISFIQKQLDKNNIRLISGNIGSGGNLILDAGPDSGQYTGSGYGVRLSSGYNDGYFNQLIGNEVNGKYGAILTVVPNVSDASAVLTVHSFLGGIHGNANSSPFADSGLGPIGNSTVGIGNIAVPGVWMQSGFDMVFGTVQITTFCNYIKSVQYLPGNTTTMTSFDFYAGNYVGCIGDGSHSLVGKTSITTVNGRITAIS